MGFVRDRGQKTTDYDDMTDEEIINEFKNGDLYALEHLLNKYKNFVRFKARSYYLIGGDSEDVIQEGMIGLYKSIIDYDESKMCCFKHFADICINRQIFTAIKTATRQKHMPLNSSISLNKPIYGKDSSVKLLDIIGEGGKIDPEEVLIYREELLRLKNKVQEVLSKLELEVFLLYIEGISYEEIAMEIGRCNKSIDNALQRIKRKLKKI